MVPCCRVVPGPCGGVALSAGIRSAGEHEGPYIRFQCQLSIECRARVLHAVDVMEFAMRGRARNEAWLVDTMNSIVGDGQMCIEDRRFVHIVPEPVESIFRE